jgi:hypothetical protein
MTTLKYVRHSKVGFVLWKAETNLWHKHVANTLIHLNGGEIISAGFCSYCNYETKFICTGESESLGIGSRSEDSKELNKFLGITP